RDRNVTGVQTCALPIYAGVSLLILLIFLAGGYSPGSLALHGAALVRAALLWLLASLAIGFAEEYLFRGYSQFILTQGIGFWPARSEERRVGKERRARGG